MTSLPDTLEAWIAAQRWYGGKGTATRLERVGGWTTDGASGGEVLIHTHYLLDRGPTGSTLYQVPLTERAAPLDGHEPIGMARGRYIYDAPHDPAYAPAILRIIAEEAGVDGARGHRQPGATPFVVTASAVLKGEQSNTSIICQVGDDGAVILKIFRILQHGDNPDVALQSVIAAAGSALVPRSIGYLSGEWPDERRPHRVANGHLAFAQEFLPEAEDAWRIAHRAAAADEDFSEPARALGAATAEVHATLATALSTRPAEPADIDAILAGMRGRLDLAIAEIPSLGELRPGVEAVFAAAGSIAWPRLQRIHGDYHLGQVLAVPGRGWVLIDFEGEPMRAMSERSEPDLALRDVAGMLRSFDYVAGSVGRERDGEPPAPWATDARRAFLDGYVAGGGRDPREEGPLLDAFELDKALYECVYEARNRPGWVEIPAAGVRSLAQRPAR